MRGERNLPVTVWPPLGKGAKGTGEADCHSQCAHWLRNDREFYMGCGGCPGGQTEASAPTECNKKCGGAGRCGERIERRRRMKRDERVAAVKILSVRRKAARKFWAPQQDHRPLRGVQGVQWAGDRKGRPYERVARGAVVPMVRRGGALPRLRATARVAPTEGYKRCGADKGRPGGPPLRFLYPLFIYTLRRFAENQSPRGRGLPV